MSRQCGTDLRQFSVLPLAQVNWFPTCNKTILYFGWNRRGIFRESRGLYKMNCWHCGHELIWGGDHDTEDDEDYDIK